MKYAFLLAALTAFNAFSSAPMIDKLQISPDGTKLSMIQAGSRGQVLLFSSVL